MKFLRPDLGGLAQMYRLLIACCVFLPIAAHAQGSIAEFKTKGEQFSLTPYVRWFVEDKGESLTPEQAQARLSDAPLYAAKDEWLELGTMQAVVWIAVTINNQIDDEHLVLEFRNPRMNFVDCFVPNASGGFDRMPSGVSRPFSVRAFSYPMPAFPLLLAPGDTTTVLLRLDNNGDFRQRFWLWDSVSFTNQVATAYLPDIMTVGILLVLFVYQCLVFIALRERSYLYLAGFVGSWMLFLMAGTGLGKMLVWQDMPWLTMRANSIFMIFMMVFFLLFTMEYLGTKRHSPRLHWLGMGYIALLGAHLVFTAFTDSLVRLQFNYISTIGFFIVIITLSLHALYRKSRVARFFIGVWIFLIVGSVLLLLINTYLLPARWLLSSPLISVLYTISILLWSFEIIGRVKVRAEEQRRLLESQVKVRTQELELALQDVKTLSGLLPICSHCKKIRDDRGYWNSVEHYIARHTDADFTHGICPDCYESHFPEISAIKREREQQRLLEEPEGL